MSGEEKRRSGRVMLTIPLRAEGVDARGESFSTPARTVNLGRYGAQVQIPRPLRRGQTVHLINPAAPSEADFRVVGLLAFSAEQGGAYGVECLDSNGNIWQIDFLAESGDEPADAKALVECRMCHTIALANLSGGELEALRTVGIVARSCQTCKAVTPARYAEIRDAKQVAAEQGLMATMARLAKPRRHRRICLQIPLGVRDSLGRFEVTRTENVSRGGFCFTSDKEYEAAQQVLVAFPGGSLSREVEVPGQIVWQTPMEKSQRKVYGMRCERPGD